MAKFSVDLTEAKEYVLCEKGEQNFKVVNSELKEYQKDGEIRKKIELACEVFGGESAGAKVFYSIFLTNPTGLYMFLNRIGVPIEKKVYLDLDTNMFLGKTFVATVEHEQYIGRDGIHKNKPVIVETSIRKYSETSINEAPDDFETTLEF